MRSVLRRVHGTAANTFAGLLIAAILASAVVAPLRAQELTAEQTEALRLTVRDFAAAVRLGDNATIFRLAPPEVLEQIAQDAGVSVDEMVNAGTEEIEAQLAELSNMKFEVDFDGRQANALADGSPYVFVPTTVTVRVPDGRLATIRSMILALPRADGWSLLQVDNGLLIGALEQVNPAFLDVTFPEPEIVRMEEP